MVTRGVIAAGLVAAGLAACAAPGAVSPSGGLSTVASESPALAGGGAVGCAALVSAAPTGVVISLAEPTAATWTPPLQEGRGSGDVARSVCRVIGQIDGDIRFEVWLPLDGWNGRFLGTGVGGNAGYLNYADMARGAEQGFAAASTDTGHGFSDVTWVADPRKSENYAHRAEHRLAEVSKAIVAGFYGQPAHHSYFIGCSGGGRQAAKELQDYPEDYDGIIAGAPGYDLAGLSARHLLASLHAVRDPAAAVDGPIWERIGAAAVTACDDADGVRDGVIADPKSCRFDVATLSCEQGSGDGCLTAPQMTAIRAIMAPVKVNGRNIDDGLWAGVTPRPGPPPGLAKAIFGLLVHKDPAWDPLTFDPDRDIPAAWAGMPRMNADRTDVRAFAARGGKAIFYHGLADPSTMPQQTIAWVEAAQRDSGAGAGDFLRLYMAPGMLHCSGGAGADKFGGAGDRQTAYEPGSNLLAALVDWVEEGRTPAAITASHVEDGRTTFTRPLCAWPQAAAYDGHGDPSLVASFTCRVPTSG
ncbi:tannase/feruloyl esterase family alpha/beta hydrolase [soil metagenome]